MGRLKVCGNFEHLCIQVLLVSKAFGIKVLQNMDSEGSGQGLGFWEQRLWNAADIGDRKIQELIMRIEEFKEFLG